MGRPKSDVTISLKSRDGTHCRLNLTGMIDGKWMVRRDGKRSKKLPYGTSTEVAEAIRLWLVQQK